MGRFILTTDNMKSLLFACLVVLAIAEPEAKADAEADPWLYYSNHYNYAPSVYSGYRPYQGYNSYPYAYGAYGAYSGLYGRKKREAAADASADPYLLYAHHGVLPYHYQPVVYSTAKVENSEAAETEATEPAKPVVPITYTYPTVYNAHPTVYNTYPSVYNYNPFLHSVVPSVATKKVVKREAEPAAEAEADPWYAYSSYQRPYAGYRPYAGFSGY